MAELEMTAPHRSLTLRRPHTDPASPLRAWSAADQLVLDHLSVDDLGRVLIVNDEFGALACGLASFAPTSWVDSALSRLAMNANLVANGLGQIEPLQLVAGHDVPTGTFDTIVIRVPKTSAQLDHQLHAVAACSTPTTRVVGTGMVRHVHSSTIAAFERLIGETVTSRATRKARLIHSTPSSTGSVYAPAVPTEFVTGHGIRVAQLPGTFSADHVDPGSALLLEVLGNEPVPQAGALVADLGCGNGVLAATMAVRWVASDFLLLDASDIAIAAASDTWARNNLGERATMRAADGFAGVAESSVDVVITNPPFHQGHALDSGLTDRLLADTARVLKGSGRAYVVAQRHLNLHTRMLRWFEAVDVVSKHPSHVVLHATNPQG